MKRWTLMLVLMILAAMLAVAACSSEDDTDGDIDGDVPDGDVPDGDVPDGDVPDGDVPDGDVPDGDVPDGDTPDGDNGIEGQIGAACTGKADCDSDFCMTAATVGVLVSGFEGTIENGYCSVLMCETDGSDNRCTAEMDAICFSLYPFSDTFASKGICLRTCETNDDCRADEDMSCLDPQNFVTGGLMTQEDKDLYYGTNKGCVPNSLAQAALDALQDEEEE